MTQREAKGWTVTPRDAVWVLNQALRADRAAIQRLWARRVACNKTLARHPTIQVWGRGPDGPYRLSWLGLLNGIFGIDVRGGGPVVAVIDDRTGRIQRFIVATQIGRRTR